MSSMNSTSNTKTGRQQKKRGQMKDDDLCVMKSKWCSLKTINVKHIQPFLIQQFILDHDDIELLRSKTIRREATEELLDIVMYGSGSDVFPIFVKCLYDAGYEDLANKLKHKTYSESSDLLVQTSNIGRLQLQLDITMADTDEKMLTNKIQKIKEKQMRHEQEMKMDKLALKESRVELGNLVAESKLREEVAQKERAKQARELQKLKDEMQTREAEMKAIREEEKLELKKKEDEFGRLEQEMKDKLEIDRKQLYSYLEYLQKRDAESAEDRKREKLELKRKEDEFGRREQEMKDKLEMERKELHSCLAEFKKRDAEYAEERKRVKLEYQEKEKQMQKHAADMFAEIDKIRKEIEKRDQEARQREEKAEEDRKKEREMRWELYGERKKRENMLQKLQKLQDEKCSIL